MENIPNKSILVTMDVRFLYTKMDGIKAMETTLKRKKSRNKNYLNISPLGFKIK